MSEDRAGDPQADIEYTDDFVAKLELLWGDGFLSPGGEAEVAMALAGVDLAGKDVLDVGCGVGGIDILLARRWGARSVLGIDVEAPVLAKAEARAAAAGLGDTVTYRQVEPGPFPLPDDGFDVVFSKDAMIHIPDKPGLYAEVLRVLRPGGVFVASDWLKGFDGSMSADMERWIESVKLHFEMASVAETEHALRQAGFTDVAVTSRNAWYREEGRREIERIEGELRPRAVELLGEHGVSHWLTVKRNMLVVLDAGEFCPSHIRARRPR